MGRLFPFERGLLHKYWCPNFWALYAAFDIAIKVICNDILKMNISFGENTTTSGVNQITKFHFLPEITSFVTIVIILIFLIVPSSYSD
jgi:alpha-1,3-glucosyltransferase